MVNSSRRTGTFFVRVASELGLRYYKITGGEPLLYEGIVGVVRSVRDHGGVPSITTNGYMLKEYAGPLSNAGVDHLNVSLHSLRREVYAALTGRDALDRILDGIREALDYGIRTKLNYLVLRPNLPEVKDLLEFASSRGLDVNLIELIPLGVSGEAFERLHVELDGVVEYLERASVRKDIEPFQNRPVYTLPSGSRVYVVKGYGNPRLCAGCTRIRVGPDGRLKLCMYRDDVYIDLGRAIRSRDGPGLQRAILEAVKLREPYFK